MSKFIRLSILCAALLALVACSGGGKKVTRIESDSVTDLSGKWNDTDSRLVAEEMIQDCIARPWYNKLLQGKNGELPTVVIGAVRNKSHEHINVETFIKDMERALINHLGWTGNMCQPCPYVIKADEKLVERIAEGMVRGITVACGGFFGPQGRQLRIPLADPNQNEKIESFEYNGLHITNFEMESSALAGLARLMGHHATTVCMVIANRRAGRADTGYKNHIDDLIKLVLDRL